MKLLLALALSVALSNVIAGPLEDNLLASSAVRLDVKGVEQALKRGAKPDQMLPHPDAPSVSKTPVQFALSAVIAEQDPDIASRAERVLRLLFKVGAKLTGDKDELFAVISGGHEKLLTLLLDNGANPHARIYGYTPAELAIKYDQEKLLPQLYSRGIPKVDKNTTAQIRLVQAAGRQQRMWMKLAESEGADINAYDPAGRLALVQVFTAPLREPDGYDAVRWLLESGADPKQAEMDDTKTTALHKLIERNSYRREDYFTTAAIAEMLLRKGADVSAVDSLGRTPLHYAAQNANLLAMQLLIRNGAKLMVRDVFRKTPLDMAKSGDAITLLREAGARE